MTTEQIELIVKRHDRLVEKVRQMRITQMNYFRYRSSSDLKLSKQLERQVDELLAEENKIKISKQQEIF